MKDSIVLTLVEVDVFLNMLGETWPIKYGNMFQQVQVFFIEKFADDKPTVKVNSEENSHSD